MNKEVIYGKESRARILAGVQKITKAVACTMGAAGKTVLVGDAAYHDGFMYHLPTVVTKDGWTVTKYFELQDAVEHRGSMMIKEAAYRTMQEAGDATTCTCVLAENLITNGMKLIDEGANSQELKKGMDKALLYVIEELKKISIPVKGDIERIRQIATVSANNDKTIGDLIASAYEKIGDDGVIDIEASNGAETEIKVSEGYKFENGYASPLFVNDAAKGTCEYENPLILLYDKKIIHHTQIDLALRIAMERNRPLVIICDDAAEEGLAFLIMNKTMAKCVVAKAPDFGDARRDSMEDIALMTGGTYVSDVRGIDIKKVELRYMGEAKKVIVSKNETIIIGGKTSKEKLDLFVDDLKMQMDKQESEEEKQPFAKRIARLKSAVAVLRVGAATETEQKEKIDRVDDAVRATKAAISEGFVAGGGTAFIRIRQFDMRNIKSGDFANGYAIIRDALFTPLKQICTNAGIEVQPIMSEVANGTGNIGYNALTDEIVDMVEAGIIDSTKALRCALTNAVSVAGMVLTSECSIISIA